jgi:hypothetical protein
VTLSLLTDRLPRGAEAHNPDALFAAFESWVGDHDLALYDHQAAALIATLAGDNTVITTPTGSGKSLIATAGHFATLAARGRSYYTAPIKALVSEKFFALCEIFGPDLVGMVTGDASVNPEAPIVCCTAEILANIALRQGSSADIDLVVADEFHFIADRDRGWAWQVPLSELPQAQFMIMSATLGDVSALVDALTASTGRATEQIGEATRPVPLLYSYQRTAIHDTIASLVHDAQAPIYVVHPTQKGATEQAQALMSMPLITPDERRAIHQAMADFRFSPGFGPTLRRLLDAGIGVHHAGLLPKYRRLVEVLAGLGLLKVICGTDTLGVGINVPIRTVLFASLVKFDGHRERLLRAREFHQLAGRAGRAGFDTVGYVVAQAPDHEVENTRLELKAGGDAMKLRSMRKAKPAPGRANYSEASFDKLIAAAPETLHPTMMVSHAMLLHLLQRDQDTAAALVHIIDAAVPDAKGRRRLLLRAVQLGKALLRAGVVVRRDRPTAGGRHYDLAEELQDGFALNQPLSAFALAAFELLDAASPDFALDMVSIVESTLEDPTVILLAQQNQARGELIASLKADGVDYDERIRLVDEVTWPRPLAELLEGALAVFGQTRPWIAEARLSPKSIVRDMFERAMTFGEFAAFYKVQRSEGLLLRYLSDAHRALRQTIPEASRTPELTDLIDWLGEVVAMTDSSLLDEWDALSHPGDATGPRPPAPERPLTGNAKVFTTLIRNALFRRVLLAADDDVDALEALEDEANRLWLEASSAPGWTPPVGRVAPGDWLDPWAGSVDGWTGDAWSASAWTGDQWDEALSDYWDEHDTIGTDAAARGPALFMVKPGQPLWAVRQIIADPQGNHDWSIQALVDPAASDRAERLVMRVTDVSRQDG